MKNITSNLIKFISNCNIYPEIKIEQAKKKKKKKKKKIDVGNIRNTWSHEFELKPMLAPFMPVNDWKFSWLCNVSFKYLQDWLNSVEQRQGNFTKDASQEILIS